MTGRPSMPVRRGVLWMSLGVLVVVVGLVLLARGGDDGPPAPTCRIVGPPSPPSAASDSGGLRIVEQGYSRLLANATTVSMGVVLENTTDRVAYRTRVTFDVLGESGESLVWERHRPWLVQEVPVILPGARVSVGDAVALNDRAPRPAASVARISITPVVTQWLPAGDGHTGLAPVTAKPVPGSSQRDEQGTGSVRYISESANCADLFSRGASLVFRDESGRIVGGNVDNQRHLSACDAGTGHQALAHAGLDTIPASADLDRTDVTVYCDFSYPVRTGESGEPINL
ncbi:hypothetical protein [Plantactinospora sp. B5E13]|uniref:hypothetical protein n=1 Tax=Plantactinospora sp. B5E13 TaxID=3153758 RepID=UPI00325FB746